MNSQQASMHDDETLSALFDGELGGEARLFAMRRLAHDADWQRATGRWQLIGDAMRRQAPIAAPVDFAARVRSAIAAESPESTVAPVVASVSKPAPRSRRVYGWAGGALAASVALAAVIGLRPGGPSVSPTPPATAIATTTPAPTPIVPAAPVAIASAEPVVDAATMQQPTDAEDRVARGASIASRPARSVATSSRSPRAESGAPVPAAAAVLVADAENPFRLQPADRIDAQPWPRASLTGATAAGFTARYENGRQSADDAPSFYPFEPRLQGGSDTAGASPTP